MSRKFCVLSATACALVLLCVPAASSAHAPRVLRFSAALAHQAARLRTPSLRPSLHPHVVPGSPVPGAIGPRIVGGYGAVQSDWPFMAFVAYFDASGSLEFTCTGTVVAPNAVLTAGHCGVDDTSGAPLNPSGFAVATGSVDWTNQSQRQVSPVSRVIINPSYAPLPQDTFDAALLVLSSPTSAPAIPLATASDRYLDTGATGALIAGWGETYDGDPLIPALLQWAPTVVQDPSYCGQFDPYFDASSELCAANPPDFLTATCFGDSGGPLAAFDASNQLVEIGITTHVPGDCNTYTADYFTNIIPISSWVAGWIKALAPPPTPAPSPAPTPPAPPSQPSQPSTLPTLTFPDAKVDVRQALAGMLGPRFKPAHQYAAKCSRASSTRITCSVKFWHGPNDYYGNVTIYDVTGKYGDTVWHDSYTVHWVNDQCYYHSGNRQACTIHTRRGAW